MAKTIVHHFIYVISDSEILPSSYDFSRDFSVLMNSADMRIPRPEILCLQNS